MWNEFDPAAYFQVIHFAEGHNGDRSAPYPTLFGPPASPDAYDRFFGDDDPATTRNFFGVDALPQSHNLWMPNDRDWAAFHADPGRWYTVRASDQGANCDAALALYRADDLTTTVIPVVDDEPAGGNDEWFSWFSGPTSGTMLVRVSQSPLSPALSGIATSYTLTISSDWGAASSGDSTTFVLDWAADAFVVGGGTVTIGAANVMDAAGHALRDPVSGTDRLAGTPPADGPRSAIWILR